MQVSTEYRGWGEHGDAVSTEYQKLRARAIQLRISGICKIINAFGMDTDLGCFFGYG